MSGSPKYTTVNLAAQRRAQLEAARRRREEERRQREEEARRQRIAAGVRSAGARADAIAARLAELTRASQGLPQQADVTTLAADVRATGAGLSAPVDEAALKKIGKRLREAERAADRLGVQVAGELTTRRHDAALAAVVAPLEQFTDRARMDPPGHASVAAAIGEATARVGDDRRFPAAHGRLGIAVQEHLGRVREREALLDRLAEESAEVAARLRAALDDAERNQIDVPERAALEDNLAALPAESDGAHVSRWQDRLSRLRTAADVVAAQVDLRLDQLDRMAIVVEAASAALPAAGLRVVDGSLAEGDDKVSFLALRSDGTPIELTVHAGDGRGSRLEYRVEGADIVVEHTGDGTVSRCDLTEDLLERFHTELGAQGVEADGLHWEGKPKEPRPPAKQQAVAPARQERGRGR
jgi:hypothetical protein